MRNLLQLDARAEIRQRIHTLAAGDTRRWGTLTLEEMMSHLKLAYAFAIYADHVPPMRSLLPPAIVKFLGLRIPLRWPRNIETIPELCRESLCPRPFAVEQDDLAIVYECFLVETALTGPHPMFGEMEPSDWMRWGYLHADHHLRQFGR